MTVVIIIHPEVILTEACLAVTAKGIASVAETKGTVVFTQTAAMATSQVLKFSAHVFHWKQNNNPGPIR